MRLYPLASEWVRYCRSSSSACPYESIERRWSPQRNKIFKGNCPCTYFACCSIPFRSVFPYLTFLTILFETPIISKLHQEVQHRSHFLHTCSNDWLQIEKILLIYFSPKVALSLLDALGPLFLLDSDWRFGVEDTSVFHSERQSGSKKTRSTNHNCPLNISANHKPSPDYWMILVGEWMTSDFSGTEK